MVEIDHLLTPATLGVLAGFLCAMSTLPELLRNFFHPGRKSSPSILRNVVLATGNALWVIYGILGGLWPVWLFCGLNFTFVLALLGQQSRN